MATASGFVWEVAPEAQIIPNLSSYDRRIIAGIGALADLLAATMEAAAKGGAPWKDQTGAARQGLRAWATKSATEVVVYLAHGVAYGLFLEKGTRYMASLPIILPVLEAHYGQAMAGLRALVGGR